MKQNYSKRLKMQISEKNKHIGLGIIDNEKGKLKKFLKNHYEFPSDNLNNITSFISRDNEIKKIIYDLPTILSKELPYDEISLDFMKETDPNEKILEITIFSELNSKILLKKEDLICDMLIDKYPKTVLEYIILVNPYEG